MIFINDEGTTWLEGREHSEWAGRVTQSLVITGFLGIPHILVCLKEARLVRRARRNPITQVGVIRRSGRGHTWCCTVLVKRLFVPSSTPSATPPSPPSQS